MLQNVSKPVTKINPGLGMFDMGISTLEDWSYYSRRTWWKAYHTSITLINFVKDVYLASSSEKSFPKESNSRAQKPLELIHTDVCGPFKPNSLGKSNYFLLFIDDFSRKTWVYFLKQKSEVFEAFKKFKAAVEKESGYQIKAMRSDRGGECWIINLIQDE